MRSTLLFAAIATLFWAAPTAAQDAGQIGVTMGYPASLGIIWHSSERFALRPEISLARSTSETTFTPLPFAGSPQLTTESWSVGVGASALLYLPKRDALRTYVSPRFSYTRTGGSTAGLSTVAAATDNVTSGYFVSGSFGAQYSFARRFSVFGEVGAAYSHAKSVATPSTFSGETTGNSVSLRSGAGVILYFGS